MRLALHAEWTKLRSLAGPPWLLVGAAVLTVTAGVVVMAVVSASGCRSTGCVDDPTRLSLVGVVAGQALVAALGVVAISSECSSGTITATLVAVPRRATVLSAKAVILAGVVTVTGSVAVLGSLVAGRVMLDGDGFPARSLTDGPAVRAALGSVLYLVLIALLGLGVGTVVRDAATSIGIVLGVLYLFPVVGQAIGGSHQRLLEQLGPMSAGLSVQTTAELTDPLLAPWAGLGVLAAWAAAALLGGALALRRRGG